MRGFGIEPERIRFVARRHNVHWRVTSASDVYALRRFGVWGRTTPGDVDWEVAAIETYAAAGVPAPRPIAPPRRVDGEIYLMMPWLGGRVLGHPPVSDGDYRRLGALLAEHHLATAAMPAPAQRPGMSASAKGAAPEFGGGARRAELLGALARVDADAAARFHAAAEALEARDLLARLADCPLRLVHGDFSTWNIKVTGGRLVGLFDFDCARLDVRAYDVAAARRGYHDPVVEGYLSVTPLSDAELAALDGLWLGGILGGLWRVLEDRIEAGDPDLMYGLAWDLEQLEKTRPWRPPT